MNAFKLKTVVTICVRNVYTDTGGRLSRPGPEHQLLHRSSFDRDPKLSLTSILSPSSHHSRQNRITREFDDPSSVRTSADCSPPSHLFITHSRVLTVTFQGIHPARRSRVLPGSFAFED